MTKEAYEQMMAGLKEAEDEFRRIVFPDCTTKYYAVHDAIKLLKEQEPRVPNYTRLQYSVNGIVHEINHPECPRCFENGLDLWAAEIERGQAYCKRCGQKVIWNND